MDKDDFANGKGFSFSFPGGLPANPNFTIKDNEGMDVGLFYLLGFFNVCSEHTLFLDSKIFHQLVTLCECTVVSLKLYI